MLIISLLFLIKTALCGPDQGQFGKVGPSEERNVCNAVGSHGRVDVRIWRDTNVIRPFLQTHIQTRLAVYNPASLKFV